MKKCENCTFHKYINQHSTCKYVIGNTYEIMREKFVKVPLRPIPSIHNAYNSCRYYKEKWLYKLLRRITNAKSKN